MPVCVATPLSKQRVLFAPRGCFIHALASYEHVMNCQHASSNLLVNDPLLAYARHNILRDTLPTAKIAPRILSALTFLKLDTSDTALECCIRHCKAQHESFEVRRSLTKIASERQDYPCLQLR